MSRGEVVVSAVLRRLAGSGWLRYVVAVRSGDRVDVETADVFVRRAAPQEVLEALEQLLVDLPHRFMIVDLPGRGTVEGLMGRKDDSTWVIGTQDNVAWINSGTSFGPTITSAIPPIYEAYATITVAEDNAARRRQETRLLELLTQLSGSQSWWLGYLSTGAHDTVFDRAPMVTVYAGWKYVLVQAGPHHADTWREDDAWRGRLPDIIFPGDHSWLLSMLWDDDWRCLGGPNALIEALLAEPNLQGRPVNITEDAAPPGHHSR